MDPLVITDPRAIRALTERSAQSGLTVDEVIIEALEQPAADAVAPEGESNTDEYDINPLLKAAQLFWEMTAHLPMEPKPKYDEDQVGRDFSEYLHERMRPDESAG